MSDTNTQTDTLTGLERIAAAFATARARGTAALMPYYTLGYPDRATSLAVIAAIAIVLFGRGGWGGGYR